MNVREIGEDSLDNALEFDRITRASYSPFSAQVTDAIISQLQQTSETRLSTDKDFNQINRLIAKYLERKNDKTISLKESVLRAEEEELKQEQKEEEEAVKQANGSNEKDIFPKEFYNKELVNISIDYLELLRSLQKTAKAAK